MSEWLIRPAEAADLDAVLDIEAAWPTTPQWSRKNFERELGNDRAYFCVGVLDGAIVGYAGLWVVPPEAQVTTVAVRPDLARRGLGLSLMRHLEAHAARRGCTVTTLEVSALNEPALRLYRGLGYAVVGRRSKYYNDGSDALLMIRHFSLSASSSTHET